MTLETFLAIIGALAALVASDAYAALLTQIDGLPGEVEGDPVTQQYAAALRSLRRFKTEIEARAAPGGG